jgi:hypothetical protein
MYDLSAIFQGVTPRPVLNHLARAFGRLADRYERLVNPCAGNFCFLQAAVASGWSPTQCQGSDISLYTSALGHLASGKRLSELGVEVSGPCAALEPHLHGDDPQHAAAILLALWIGTHTGKDPYSAQAAKHVLKRRDVYLAGLAGQVEQLCGALSGMSYEAADCRGVIAEAVSDPLAVVTMAPPWYAGGYTKMWRTEAVTWRAPEVPELTPGEAEEIDQALDSAACLSLLVSRRPRDEILPDALFAQEAGGERFAVLTCNRPDELEAISCKRRGAHLKLSRGLHLWDGHLPQPDSRVHVAVLDAADATLIRDLWSTLPLATSASFALGFFLDGQVFGVSSYDNRRLSLGKTNDLSEIFGITPPNGKRLGSLLYTLSLADDTLKLLEQDGRFRLYLPEAITSTFYSDHPSLSRMRGLMKLYEREEDTKHGKFTLKYRGEFNNNTWGQAYRRWWQRWGVALAGAEQRPGDLPGPGGPGQAAGSQRPLYEPAGTEMPAG